MPHFHDTVIGKHMLEGTIPQALKVLVNIHEELRVANRLRSQQIELSTEQNDTLARLANKPAEDIRLRDAEARIHATIKMVENTANLNKATRDMLLDELRSDLT